MLTRGSRVALVGLAVLGLLSATGCKKKGPAVVVASCDLRNGKTSEAQICTDVHDKGFAPIIRPICAEADPTGKNWSETVACDRTGSLGGCKSDSATMWYYPTPTEASADDVQKKCAKKDKFVRPEDDPSPNAPRVAASGAKSATPAQSLAQAPDLAALLGTKADGWLPKSLLGLKKNMTPAQAAKVFPGANKLDEYGTVEIPVKGVKGVVKYRLHFVDKELFSVDIWFDPSLHKNKAFRDMFVAAGKAKWGAPKSENDEHVLWFSPTSQMASFDQDDSTMDKYNTQM